MADSHVSVDDSGIQTAITAEGGKIHSVRMQDVEPFIRAASAERAAHSKFRKSNDGLGDKVACFPMVVVEKWIAEYGFNWFRATRAERNKWLDGPYAAPFLTKPRKLR